MSRLASELLHIDDNVDMSEMAENRRGPGRPPEPGIIERRRGELVEAAYAVFSRKGYADTGIADIVAELGVGRGTFYRYFENKRDILVSVLDYGIRRVMSRVFGPDLLTALGTMNDETTTDELMEHIRGALDRACELAGDDPGMARVVAFELSGMDDALTQRLLGLNDVAAKGTEVLLARGIELGLVRADLDTEMTAHVMIFTVMPAIMESLRGSLTPQRRKRIVDTAIMLARGGIMLESS